MRRVSLLAVIVLCCSVLGALSSRSVLGQGEENCALVASDAEAMRLWECVERPVPIEGDFTPEQQQTASGGKRFQAYTVELRAQLAAVPDISDFDLVSEYMVVTVEEGDFALDIKENSPSPVIVDPADDRQVTVMDRVGSPEYYKDRDSESDGVLKSDDGAPCTDMCAIPANTVVHVQTNDTIYALQGSLCIWCLLNRLELNEDPNHGLLRVVAMVDADGAPENFSWIQAWDHEKENPTANAAPSGTMKAWVLLNPGTGCRDH
jgi:hypothetical protein